MDLSTSCGLRRSGSVGLEPATRCRSKHQGRRKSVGCQVDEMRDDPSTAMPTRPDESISGTSNPIAAKPTRPDEMSRSPAPQTRSLPSRPDQMSRSPAPRTRSLPSRPDQTSRSPSPRTRSPNPNAVSKALTFLILHFSCGLGCRGKDRRLRRLASHWPGVRGKVGV